MAHRYLTERDLREIRDVALGLAQPDPRNPLPVTGELLAQLIDELLFSRKEQDEPKAPYRLYHWHIKDERTGRWTRTRFQASEAAIRRSHPEAIVDHLAGFREIDPSVAYIPTSAFRNHP